MRGRRHRPQGPSRIAYFMTCQAVHSRGCTSRGSERAEDSPSAAQDRPFKTSEQSRQLQSRRNCEKGSWTWNTSNRGRRTAAKLAEHHRCLAATRKRDHGELVNDLLQIGGTIKIEKNNYRSFQRCFGRSTNRREWASLWSISNARLKVPAAR